MNSSKFTGLLYLGKITPQDCVDWANTCLQEGKDGEYLRQLASMNKNYLDKDEVFKLVRGCFADIGFRCHPNEINSLLSEAKEVARKILSSEIEPFEGVVKISGIAGQIDFPFYKRLSDWIYLEEQNHPECLEKGWIFYKTNPQKWLEIVMREAKKLAESDFEIDVRDFR
ncbi:MAG: hypothetical protein LH614_05260 [Pyrinomonadaceae bacterium]|nr:hypothetical protein [Pyrinomonadaceae bacterium]